MYGARGSGRTALALSLALHPSVDTKPFLGLYSTDSSGLPEIQKGFAKKLLLFVERYRREVAALSAEDRKLLAHCLGTYLGWDLAASEAERIRKDESDLEGFNETGRDFWRRTINAAFDHLQNALNRSRASPSTPAWPRDLCVCAQSLQLNRVLLVVDVNDDDAPQLRNEILPRLTNWAEDGLTALIFLPGAESKTRAAARGVPVEMLKWDAEQLLDMLEHRRRSGLPVQPADALLAQLREKCVNGECTPRVLRELCVGSAWGDDVSTQTL